LQLAIEGLVERAQRMLQPDTTCRTHFAGAGIDVVENVNRQQAARFGRSL
jgi:hypothetical protein